MDTTDRQQIKLYLSILNKKFRLEFKELEEHEIECPHCNNSKAKAVWESAAKQETIESRRERSKSYWSPECIRYNYSLSYECLSCNGTIYSVGSVEHHYYEHIDEETGEREDEEYDEFHPNFFTPTICIFKIPIKCPERIKLNLTQSFKLAYCDIPAAANRLRATLEILIKLHFTPEEIGGRRLHDQITLLAGKYPEIAGLSLAIKWIGNEGSHGDEEIKEGTLAFAYQAFDKILNTLYGKKEPSIEEMANLVVKSKGVL